MFRGRFWLFMAALGVFSTPGFATLVTYTAASSFASANTDQTFQNLTFPTLTGSSTSYTDLSTGILFTSTSGLSVVVNPNAWADPASGNVLQTNSPGGTINITLPTTARSFGFYLGGVSTFLDVQITVADSSGGSYSQGLTQPFPLSVPRFWGVRSDSAITALTLVANVPNEYLALGPGQLGSPAAETPEAATMLMIGTGLIILRFLRRKPKLAT